VAGPDGGTDEKPVGLVYIAVAGLGTAEVRRYLWPGDRSANKHDSAVAAIELLLARVESAPRGGDA
jgi:nicotinamide-nucleotide amidase